MVDKIEFQRRAFRGLTGESVRIELSSGRTVEGRLDEAGRDFVVIETGERETVLRISAVVLVEREPWVEPELVVAPALAAQPPATDFDPEEQREQIVRSYRYRFDAESLASGDWHERIRAADEARVMAAEVELAAGARPEDDLVRGLAELVGRHPGSAGLHGLQGAAAWARGDWELARGAFLRGGALGDGGAWGALAAAEARLGKIDRSLFALERRLLQEAASAELTQAFVGLAAQRGHGPGLAAFIAAAAERDRGTERDLTCGAFELAGLSVPEGGGWEQLKEAAWQSEREGLAEAREGFSAELKRIRAEGRFAGLEEDINGLIDGAEELFAKGRLEGAFEKLNQGYQLSPGHTRVRVVEERFRSGGADSSRGLDLPGLEATLGHILRVHHHTLLDTSVLTLGHHLTRDEAALNELLRATGAPGLIPAEELVAYQKLLERVLTTYSKRVTTTEGVIRELHAALESSFCKGRHKDVGRALEGLTRKLASWVRKEGLSGTARKRLRTLQRTFPRMRSKGGLSEVDFELLTRSFVLAMEGPVALLTNDRGIHTAAGRIHEACAKNRNIAFLVPDQLEVYSSLHRSHFALVSGARV